MNTETAIKTFGLSLCFASASYFTLYVKDNEFHTDPLPVVVSHTYETDDTNYYNGEILLPDYAHIDTLVVTDANFLNKWMQDYNIASDGDISDILGEGTKPLHTPVYDCMDSLGHYISIK